MFSKTCTALVFLATLGVSSAFGVCSLQHLCFAVVSVVFGKKGAFLEVIPFPRLGAGAMQHRCAPLTASGFSEPMTC